MLNEMTMFRAAMTRRGDMNLATGSNHQESGVLKWRARRTIGVAAASGTVLALTIFIAAATSGLPI